MLEDHATDFVEKCKTGFGLYDEEGGESIHNEFNQIRITYCWMQFTSRRLKSMLREHYRRIYSERKAVKFKNKLCIKRTRALQYSQFLNSWLYQVSYLKNLDLISVSNLKTLIDLLISYNFLILQSCFLKFQSNSFIILEFLLHVVMLEEI